MRKITKVSLGTILIFLLCLVFLRSGATQAPICVSAPADLVSWWDGDDVSATTAFDIQNGNHGTLNGVTTVPGKVGNAFMFSGRGDDYVRVPNDPSLEPANVTVDAWVRASEPPGVNRYIVAKGAYTTWAASYALYTWTGGLYFYVFNPFYGYIHSPGVGPSIWDGTWHHVAGTYDGQYVRLYVDSVEIGDGTPTTIGIGYGLLTHNDLLIGQYTWGWGSLFAFQGDVDEVEIFERALMPDEIMSIYDADSAGKCKFINPVDELEKLVDEVEKLADEGVLNQGEANALNSKLGEALKSLEMGNTEVACNKLQAFINQVNAFIRAGIFTQEHGQPLIEVTEAVISELCGG